MMFLGGGRAWSSSSPRRSIVGLFTHRPGGRSRYAVGCLRIVSLGFVFYAYGMVLTPAFNGAGDTWTPTLINLFVFWLFEIPLAWLLAAPRPASARGVFIALTLAYSMLAVVSALLFKRGRWRRVAL